MLGSRFGRHDERSLLLSLELLEVELKLSALKNVAVASARLAGSGGDTSIKSTKVELVGELLVDHAVLAVSLKVSLDMSGLLGLSSCLVALLDFLLVQLDIVMLQVPLSEGVSINGHDAVLHDGLGSHELVVGSVVHNVKNSSLARDGLGSPGESAVVDSESSSLLVASSTTDESNSLSSELGVGSLSTHFVLSLLLVDGHPSSGGPSLVPRISVNTHDLNYVSNILIIK